VLAWQRRQQEHAGKSGLPARNRASKRELNY
jgi:hypothetical protein